MGDDDLHQVKKLCIGWCWQPPMVWSKVMDNYLSLQRPENSFWVRGYGWCGARRHIDICEKATTGGASHILIVGADQVHPVDMIPRLIARIEQDKCDAISGIIPVNGKTLKLKYFQYIGCVQNKSGIEGDWDCIDISKGNLQKIEGTGSGALMFPVSALNQLTKPWFRESYDELTYVRSGGVDVEFTHRLKLEAGLQLWADTTIKVKHLIPFQVDETFEKRFEDWNDK